MVKSRTMSHTQETKHGLSPKISRYESSAQPNLEAKIRNPLAGIPKAQLFRDVEAFADKRGLRQHLAVLRKGALLAQNETPADEISGNEKLSDDELTILNTEVKHKWHIPFRLFLTIATCSIGAAVQGWDQTGSNGASLFFPGYYGIADGSTRSRIILGVVNAGPYLGSACIGCWLSDPINSILGRRGVIFVSAHFCLWPVLASAFCETWEQQLACRLLMGVGMGVKASTVPIYAAENSPAAIRGALVMSWQMWTAFGIALGTGFNLAVFRTEHNWRWMLGAPCLPAIPLLFLIYLCPESPRWYMKKDRYPEAWKSMRLLRHSDLQVARDIYYISARLEIEKQLAGTTTYPQRFQQLFVVPRIRRATLAAFTVMLAQQMCGINIIAFYSTSIFQEAGLSSFLAMVGSFGWGMVNWLFAFPAFWTIDTFGRRNLLLFTFPQMFWTLLGAGLCTLISREGSIGDIRNGLICLFVFLFGAFYAPGEGPVPFAYSAEVFPLSHREAGMAFSVSTCLGWAGVLGITFPFLLERAGAIGAFGMYAGLNLLAFIMIFLWVPETKQLSLEELDGVFNVPTRSFMRYQCGTIASWFVKRYLLFGWVGSKEDACPALEKEDEEGICMIPMSDSRTSILRRAAAHGVSRA